MANLVPLLQLVNHFVALFSLPAIILLVTNIPSHADALLISIDCGWNGSSSCRDENSVVSTGDDAYVHNKDESQVFQQYDHSNTEDWTNTESFPNLEEKLLHNPSWQSWGETTCSSKFQFDGNFWATVVTQPYNIVSYEAIYVCKANTTNICLAQIKDDRLPPLHIRTRVAELGFWDVQPCRFQSRSAVGN